MDSDLEDEFEDVKNYEELSQPATLRLIPKSKQTEKQTKQKAKRKVVKKNDTKETSDFARILESINKKLDGQEEHSTNMMNKIIEIEKKIDPKKFEEIERNITLMTSST